MDENFKQILELIRQIEQRQLDLIMMLDKHLNNISKQIVDNKVDKNLND